jgi:hypothetical protein
MSGIVQGETAFFGITNTSPKRSLSRDRTSDLHRPIIQHNTNFQSAALIVAQNARFLLPRNAMPLVHQHQ